MQVDGVPQAQVKDGHRPPEQGPISPEPLSPEGTAAGITAAQPLSLS